MHELRGAPELALEQALARLSPCDLALVEGYKAYPIPKLEIWRDAVGKPLLHLGDPRIVGIATDSPKLAAARYSPIACRSSRLSDIDAIATFVTANATADLIGD